MTTMDKDNNIDDGGIRRTRAGLREVLWEVILMTTVPLREEGGGVKALDARTHHRSNRLQ